MWEDVIGRAPTVPQTVPADFTEFIASDPQHSTAAKGPHTDAGAALA